MVIGSEVEAGRVQKKKCDLTPFILTATELQPFNRFLQSLNHKLHISVML